MNLRENRLSSRFVIPVALALPINRDPAKREPDPRESEREPPVTRDDRRSPKGAVSFYI